MQLKEVYVEGYRSLKSMHFAVGPLTVFVGRNAAGKTNLYRALSLLQAAAHGCICRAIAEEGGVDSVLWAGQRERLTQRLVLGAMFDTLEYRIEIGLPALGEAALDLEPMVRSEQLILNDGRSQQLIGERKGPLLWLRDGPGEPQLNERQLLPSETALAAIRDGGRYPELSLARQTLQSWRFYHDIRTDEQAAVRRPGLCLSAPTLSCDGSDLASVFATVFLVKEDPSAIAAAVSDAFPGAELMVSALDGRCRFSLQLPGLPRPFSAHELSDGTLRYLYLVGALMGFRLPPFIVLNEPEASLHPDLLPPLARLISQAAERTQVWVVTHSDLLADELAEQGGEIVRLMRQEDGATRIDQQLRPARRAGSGGAEPIPLEYCAMQRQ